MSDGKNYLSNDTLAYCGYKIEGNHLRESCYNPDPSDRRVNTRCSSPSNHEDDGMLYDPIDIGTDLCK